MDKVFAAYLRTLRRRRRAECTIRNAEIVLVRLDHWLARDGTAAKALTPLACARYFDQQLDQYALSTVHHQLSTVRAAYRFGLRHHLARRDPTADVILPRLPESEPITYTNDELRAILAAAQTDREMLLFHVLAFAGLRLAEAGALSWQAIDLTKEQMTILGKGGKLRIVPLHPALSRTLRTHQHRQGTQKSFVLAGRRNQPLAPTTLNNAVSDMTTRGGLTDRKTTSHTFRRTVASNLYEQGVRRRVIEKIMGWAPRTIADRHYIRIAHTTMHTAIRTLYQDDPISNPPSQDPHFQDPVRQMPTLGDDIAKLIELERKYAPKESDAT